MLKIVISINIFKNILIGNIGHMLYYYLLIYFKIDNIKNVILFFKVKKLSKKVNRYKYRIIFNI